MASVNLLSEMTLGWYSSYEESLSSPILDRTGIAIAFANMLKDDTSILYGASNYLQIIDPNPVNFSKAHVDAKRNHGALYVWARPEDSNNTVRMQNSDDRYVINMRFEMLNIDIMAGIREIDDAFERVKYLTNDQMWGGLAMSSWFTDSNAKIINIEPITSDLPEPESTENSLIVIEVESGVLVEVNRWK